VQIKQGVALTGRNRTGPPCSVGHSTANAPDPAAADRPRARRPARQPAGSVTDDDDRRYRAKQYWPIRWASNKLKSERHVKSAIHHLHELSIRKMHRKCSFVKELSEINSLTNFSVTMYWTAFSWVKEHSSSGN